MTALQWIVKEAKAQKKKYPTKFKTWKEYIKQASKQYNTGIKPSFPTKKVGTVKKKAAKKPTKYKSKLTNKYKPIKSTDNIQELKKYGYQLKGVTKKPTEKAVLKSIQKAVKTQKSHMSGLTKIVGKIYNKYFIQYMHPNGYKSREYYNKYPTNRYVGVDGYIYVPKLTQSGTSLVALKHSKTDKQVKK
jgi:hypothetical protein